MVRLVDDLLDVSRIMRGKIQLRKERVQLADVIARGVETARPLIDTQKHELAVSLPPRAAVAGGGCGPHRPGHRQPVEQRGQVQRQARPHLALRQSARRGGRPAGAGRRRGHRPGVAGRVFDLFTQADRSVARSQGGLGIGLTLVRSLVERHGGSVECASEGPGKGSEFVVRLPAAASSGRPRAGDGKQPGRPPRAGPGATVPRRVLIVDDNVDAARAFAEVASLWKHDVRIASNGAAALELAKSYHPDVVLLDIGLPGMSGYQVAKQLRRQPEFAKTLLVAGHRLRPGRRPPPLARGGFRPPPGQAGGPRRVARSADRAGRAAEARRTEQRLVRQRASLGA